MVQPQSGVADTMLLRDDLDLDVAVKI